MVRDIFEILSNQHDEIRRALQKLACTTTADVRVRRDEAGRLAVDVVSLNEAEADTLYSRLIEIPELEGAVEKQQNEHDEANAELRALIDMDAADEAWLKQLSKVARLIERHLADEEDLLFPRARTYLGESEAERLAQSFRHDQSLRKGLLKAA